MNAVEGIDKNTPRKRRRGEFMRPVFLCIYLCNVPEIILTIRNAPYLEGLHFWSNFAHVVHCILMRFPPGTQNTGERCE